MKMGCKIKLVEKLMDEGYDDIEPTYIQKRETSLPKVILEKTPVFYPYFIVYDFEAMLVKDGEEKTEHFIVEKEHIPVSVAIHSNFEAEPIYLVNSDPKELVKDFVKELYNLRDKIVEDVYKNYPKPEDFEYLPNKTQKA